MGWPRFHIRTLMIVVAVVAVLLNINLMKPLLAGWLVIGGLLCWLAASGRKSFVKRTASKSDSEQVFKLDAILAILFFIYLLIAWEFTF